MKLKMILLALAAMALTASVALAKPPEKTKNAHAESTNANKPPKTGEGCKPKVSVVLRGTVAVAPGATPVLPFSLMITVEHANHHGWAYATATQPVAVTVTSDTRVKRQHDETTLASFLAGDRVAVHARVCKADLAGQGAAPPLSAGKVKAHPVTPA
jgi:predicted secreted protein